MRISLEQYEKLNELLKERCKNSKLDQEKGKKNTFSMGSVEGIRSALKILDIKMYSESVTDCFQVSPSSVDEAK